MENLDLKKLREVAEKATPGPWGPWSGNYPFYVEVKKPAPSLSKYEGEKRAESYWRYEDAVFVLQFNPETVIMLLDRIKELESEINK